MSRYFLSELQVEGFRGINNEKDPLTLSFRADSVNSVFAPNAQGKSSVFEALCYALGGNIPKLASLPESEHADEYYANRFHPGGTSVIGLKFTDEAGQVVEICVTRMADGTRQIESPSGHPDPSGFLAAFDTQVCLVDHRTFQSFVEDTPLLRGRTFSRLLGLGRLSEARQAFEALANTRALKADLGLETLAAEEQAARARLRFAQEKVRRVKVALLAKDEAEPPDLDALVEEATRALASVELLEGFFNDKDIRTVDWPEVKEAIKHAEDGEKQTELAEVERAIVDLDGLGRKADETVTRTTLRDTATERDVAVASTRGAQFQKLYELALEIVKSPAWSTPNRCPACEAEHRDPVAPRFEERLQEYRDVAQKTQAATAAWLAAVEWKTRLERLATSSWLPVDKARAAALSALCLHGEKGDLSTADLDQLEALETHFDAARTTELASKRGRQAALRAELPPSLVALTQKVTQAEQLGEGIGECLAADEDVRRCASKAARRSTWVEFVGEAARAFAAAEVRLSTKKTKALESEYGTLYQDITRNPDIVPALEKQTASEELHLVLRKFYGLTDVAAPPLLSESYRNALAISIFLSAALQDRSASRFIVMDDITSSFDSGHQLALMEILRTKVGRPGNDAGPQVILLSHDGLLEKFFDRVSSDGGWHHQRIQGMPPRGDVLPQQQDANRHRRKAEDHLRAGAVDQAAPFIRQYLEFKLLEIIRRVRIPVPLDFAIRDDRKLAQACLDAIEASVALHRAGNDLVLDPAQQVALGKHHVPAIVGNWLSHYATGTTSSLIPHVLLGLLDDIDQLSACFQYDCNCDGTIRRRFYGDLAHKGCSC